MKTVAFVPVKLNNERLPGKNIRSFTNGRPLITYILDSLLHTSDVDEIYVYCSDAAIQEYLPEKVKFLKRDPYYDLSTTSFNEVLISFAELVKADVYVLTHATAPFISPDSIRTGVKKVRDEGFDSALSVSKIQEFLWKDGYPFNYDVDQIPRTQDLSPFFAETCGLYVYTRELIIKTRKRVGSDPYLIEVSKIEACDINEPIDFMIADAIYQQRLKWPLIAPVFANALCPDSLKDLGRVRSADRPQKDPEKMEKISGGGGVDPLPPLM